MSRVVFLLFCLTLAVLPAPLASNRDWAWSPLAAVAGLLLICAGLSIVLDADLARRLRDNLGALAIPACLTAVAVAWALLQISGWTPESWKTPISAVSVLGSEAALHTVAFDREAVLTGIMRWLTNVAFFLLGMMLGNRVDDARRLLASIVVAATLYTLYAMVAQVANSQAAWTGLEVWVPTAREFTGTFVNRNNYATYAGIAAVAALCLAFRPRRSEADETWRQRWHRRLAALSGARAFWLAAALILVVGVILSASKAGGISLSLALVAMAFIYTRGNRRIAAVAATVMIVLLAVLVLPGATGLVVRLLALATFGDADREIIYGMTLQAIELRPWTGWGLNSFSGAAQMFQPVTLRPYYDKAHNTYLELAFDLGIPAAACIVLAVALIVLRCLRGFYERRRDPELAGAGFLVGVLTGFHAFFDFSLQIPAMACTFFAILGISWAQSWRGRRAADGEDA